MSLFNDNKQGDFLPKKNKIKTGIHNEDKRPSAFMVLPDCICDISLLPSKLHCGNIANKLSKACM